MDEVFPWGLNAGPEFTKRDQVRTLGKIAHRVMNFTAWSYSYMKELYDGGLNLAHQNENRGEDGY